MRRGITLVELLVVLVILTIVLGATAPALAKIGEEDPSKAATRELVSLLRAARRSAVEQGVTVSVVIDPRSGRYWLASEAAVPPPVRTGFLSEDTRTQMITTTDRVSFVFDPRGVARGDSVVVRTGEGFVNVGVNHWTGAPYAR